MRIPCPCCGERNVEEFTTLGTLPPLPRPALDAPQAEWDAHVYERDNPAGPAREYWHHVSGCRSWLIVERDTRTHVIRSVEIARKALP
jgi:heterotetrameric sarcosine oxidase delta subunit